MEGGVWFRANIGRQKNAEARWLLPMICRRGGIDKRDIGAIRIFDATTEFEVSAQAADKFAVKIKRPDKEDNIRIEPLNGEPQRYIAPDHSKAHKPRYKGGAHRDRRDDGPKDRPKTRGAHHEDRSKTRAAHHEDRPSHPGKKGGFKDKHKQGGFEQHAKRDFVKKPKKKR
jgi:ATP-dependent RNA helicase DeaD